MLGSKHILSTIYRNTTGYEKNVSTLLAKVNQRYLRESVYGMEAVLMYNFGKDKLKDLGIKAKQKDFNALKFKSAVKLTDYPYVQKTFLRKVFCLD